MKNFITIFLCATFVTGVNAIAGSLSDADGCGQIEQPSVPFEEDTTGQEGVLVSKRVYVVQAELNSQICEDEHVLATFDLDPFAPHDHRRNLHDAVLVGATLTVAAQDVEPDEARIIMFNNTNLGNLAAGGTGCWSVTPFQIAIEGFIEAAVANQYNVTSYLYGPISYCSAIGWVSLELTYEHVPEVQGDPHFSTWGGDHYDFHGICDLVLLHAPQFRSNTGMDIHIRTTKTRQWSFVSAVAVRIGEDILEVRGGANMNYWTNGVKGAEITDSAAFPKSIFGYTSSFSKLDATQKELRVDLGEGSQLVITTWNAYVKVGVEGSNSKDFGTSVGLMGSYPHGERVGRDGVSIKETPVEFGQEWQVLPSENVLFHTKEGPQAPTKCEIPSAEELRRRLGEISISVEDAELACSRVNPEDFDLCVFDVMATNNKETSGAY